MFGSGPDGGGASEPFGTAPGRSTVPVIAIAAVAVVPVGVAVHAHFALEPVMAPAFPAPEPGQNGEPPLPALTPHGLRRSFASLLYAIGEPPPVVMAEFSRDVTEAAM